MLEDGTSVPGGVDADDCTFFGLHTILFDLGGVVVDFGASSFCFHTILGGVGINFGASYFCFRLFFFGFSLFLFSLFSWWGCPPVEVVSQPLLCLVGSAHIWYGSWLLPGPKVKFLLLAIDVEADFSSSNINLSSCGAEERSPKDEGQFFRGFHVQHHEVNGDKVTPYFHRDIFSDPYRVADRAIG